ncbi:MAG: CCA tRNA nucleotidyltransferase [Chlamydiae bacterium]|nr:CCA tRNA nucleotidyltransferase [Chlamydiota bacterium]
MDVFQTALKILEKIRQTGGTAYIAGGAVRDLLMGTSPNDIDIVTSLSVDALRPLFKKTIEVGVQFGILVVVEEGNRFEIASFRTEAEYKDGRRPEIILEGTPEEDAKRRDFTINGMFLDPFTNETIDFVGGKEDLKEKKIRAIGNPHDRFREDRLRMIRAIRYASRFQFHIDPATQEAIKEHAPTLLPAVSFERILQELEKMHGDKNLCHALIEMQRLGLLQVIFPPLENMTTDTILSLRQIQTAPVILQLKSLLDFLPQQERFEWIKRLKFSQKDLDLLLFSDELLTHIESSTLQQRVHLYASPHFESASLLLPQDAHHFTLDERKIYLEQIERIQKKKPIVTAQDLLERGIKAGPEMGLLLKEAENIALQHKLQDKQEILKRLFSKRADS